MDEMRKRWRRLEPARAAIVLILAVAACGPSWRLNQEVSDLIDAERYAEAEPVARRALEHDERTQGPDAQDVAIALSNLSTVLVYRGRHAEAEPLMRRSLAIREKGLGPDDPAVAVTLNNLAALLAGQARYIEAEPLYRRSMAIVEKARGPDDPEIAAAASNLATLLMSQGRFSEAETLYLRSLALQEASPSQEPAKLAGFLSNLARLRQAQRRHADAERLFRRCLAIYESEAALERANAVGVHYDLAGLMAQQGRLAEAEALYRRGLMLREAIHGPEHGAVAHALGEVAGLMLAQGRHAEAETLYRRGLAIWEVSAGPESNEVALALNNLAATLDRQGRHADAEPLHRRSRAIAEKVHGPDSGLLATSLNNLGFQYRLRGRFAEAEPLLRRSLGIRERMLGPDHADVGNSLGNLALLHRDQGRLDDAEPLFLRSQAIYEAALGAEHPLVAQSAAHLAGLRTLQGRPSDALRFHRRSSAIRAGRIDRAADAGEPEQARLSEQRLSARAFFEHMATAIGLAAGAAPAERAALLDEAFRLLDRAKATATGAAVSRMAARFAAGDGALARLVREQQDAADELAAADANLIKASAKPPQQRHLPAERSLRERAAALQARMSAVGDRLRQEFPAYAEIAGPRPASLAEAQALLGPDEALVASAVGADATIVFALRRDRVAAVRLALKADDLAAAVGKLRAGLDPTGKSEIGSMAPFAASEAHALFAALLAPFAALLDDARHLFVVPDGALDSLPVGVLLTAPPAKAQFDPDDAAAFREAAWLGQRAAVSVLPTVGSLRALRRFAREARASRPFLGIGDPLLKDHPRDPATKRGAASPSATRIAAAARPSLRALFRGGTADTDALRQVPSLPDTADELAAMARALGATDQALVLRERATEAAVKRAALAEHKVLAFATHGIVAGEIAGLAEPALLLTPPTEATAEDDGLLTASEVAELKLDADWVILSACNTAAPDGTPGAEGLSGLARAFFYAGARALLVSHWPVVSDAAVALTTRMLQEAARPGVGRAEAHRRAMAAMIADAALPERAHPLFWAPFVVVGEGGAKR
ncbi:MAG: CHAT domain-containing protein [Alphaproteobacteria bacterium]|nr:CHAT domain-containing protein [Alphaproteobacteria bacterium]